MDPLNPAVVDSSATLEHGLFLVCLLQVVAALFLLGAAPGYLQRRTLATPAGAVSFAAAPPLAAIIAGFLFVLALPPAASRVLIDRLGILSDPASTATLRMAGLTLIAAAAVVLSAGWWDRLYILGPRRGLIAMASVVPQAAVYAAVGLGVVVLWVHPRTASPAGRFPLAGIPLILGLNAGGLARALANRGLDRVGSLLVTILPTAAGAAITYWFFCIALGQTHTDWPAAQVLLGAEPDTTVSLVWTLSHWAGGYAVAVVVVGLGGWAGIRLAPRPRIARTPRGNLEIAAVPRAPHPARASDQALSDRSA